MTLFLSGNKSQHTLSDKSPERLALNSPFHFPLPRKSSVPSFLSDHEQASGDDGGGLLRADNYHTRKVCQAVYVSALGLN